MKNLLIITLMSLTLSVNASELTIPNNFVANTPAVAAQVNANFLAVEVSVDDNDSRLDTIEVLVAQLQTDLSTANATISTLQTDLSTANATISTLQVDLANVENNTVLELDGILRLAVIDGYDTAEFNGVNVQVNNGTGTTHGIVNGLGNLTIGYNNNLATAPFFCSDPQYTDSVSCIGNLEIWAQNVRTGSHNLIVGESQSYTKYGAVIAGNRNVSNGNYTFLGGDRNIANGNASSITGGQNNIAGGYASSITGGQNNTVGGSASSITGGRDNIAGGSSSSITGGQNNIAGGTYSSITGGDSNVANGVLSSITGGRDNIAGGSSSSITGGRNNVIPAGAHWSSISGGNTRSTVGFDDWVGGSLFENN